MPNLMGSGAPRAPPGRLAAAETASMAAARRRVMVTIVSPPQRRAMRASFVPGSAASRVRSAGADLYSVAHLCCVNPRPASQNVNAPGQSGDLTRVEVRREREPGNAAPRRSLATKQRKAPTSAEPTSATCSEGVPWIRGEDGVRRVTVATQRDVETRAWSIEAIKRLRTMAATMRAIRRALAKG